MTDNPVDCKRRRFLTAAASVVGGTGAVFTCVPFISSMQPSARTRAEGAPVEVDIAGLEPGKLTRVMWRKKPVWILKRSPEMLATLNGREGELRDPDSQEPQQPPYAQNKYRSTKPEYLILIGICTHLGCSPTYIPAGASSQPRPGWPGGFYCPCHGSEFDLAGRVTKGVPAPSNLVVPPHEYLTETELRIGTDPEQTS